ncbi:hypothetical protein [uncultured Mucilaginibacter sp.]|nr:hypothetical protein [uncultured Mucilaginibacter sp.]
MKKIFRKKAKHNQQQQPVGSFGEEKRLLKIHKLRKQASRFFNG